jgi:hypothetical protein
MHPVIQGLVTSFSGQHCLVDVDPANQMEYFTDYCVVSPFLEDEAQFVEAHLHGTEYGVDGIALILNGRMVFSASDVDDICGTTKTVDIDLIFTQAKRSEALAVGSVSSFLSAVEGFVGGAPAALATDQLREIFNAYSRVFDYAAKFRASSPRILSCCSFTGRTDTIGPETQLVVKQFLERIDRLDVFAQKEVKFFGRQELQGAYRRLSAALEKSVQIERSISLPNIEGVSEAYIGVIPALGLKALISDEHGAILGNIFYENIRDFDPKSEINDEIRNTITSGDGAQFSLRNNGITVLCPTLRKVGDTFHLSDFQIINGCQTSHVIHSCSEIDLVDAFVPIKLVSTSDDTISSAVIISSNQQNEVKSEQFWSLRPVHKEYEEFFNL